MFVLQSNGLHCLCSGSFISHYKIKLVHFTASNFGGKIALFIQLSKFAVQTHKECYLSFFSLTLDAEWNLNCPHITALDLEGICDILWLETELLPILSHLVINSSEAFHSTQFSKAVKVSSNNNVGGVLLMFYEFKWRSYVSNQMTDEGCLWAMMGRLLLYCNRSQITLLKNATLYTLIWICTLITHDLQTRGCAITKIWIKNIAQNLRACWPMNGACLDVQIPRTFMLWFYYVMSLHVTSCSHLPHVGQRGTKKRS